MKQTLMLLIGMALLVSCGSNNNQDQVETETETKQEETKPTMEEANVFELAIRKVNVDVDVADFTTARDAFVAKLMAEKGTSNDREFKPFFDYSGQELQLENYFIGMTQYESLDLASQLSDKLSKTAEAAAFFGKMELAVFELLQPLEGYGPVDLGKVVPKESGQILEIAVRDISAYQDFDQVNYETARDAFLEKLSSLPGFLKEIQWQSVTNPNIVIGMTIYENLEGMQGIAGNQEFANSEVYKNFIYNYPPSKWGTMNQALK